MTTSPARTRRIRSSELLTTNNKKLGPGGHLPLGPFASLKGRYRVGSPRTSYLSRKRGNARASLMFYTMISKPAPRSISRAQAPIATPRDPSTSVLVLCYCVDDEPIQRWFPGDPVPPEFVEAANNPDWTIAAHNVPFERACAMHILGPRHGFPEIPLERWRCSMAMARAAAIPAGLEKAVEAIGLPHTKDKAGQALMRRMCQPLPDGSWIEDPESLERLATYCEADVGASARFITPCRRSPMPSKRYGLSISVSTSGASLPTASCSKRRTISSPAPCRRGSPSLRRSPESIRSISATRFLAWLAEHDCELPDLQKATPCACASAPRSHR